MGLVKDDEVIGGDVWLAEPGEHFVCGEGIQLGDEAVGIFADEGVAVAGVGTADDTEGKVERG